MPPTQSLDTIDVALANPDQNLDNAREGRAPKHVDDIPGIGDQTDPRGFVPPFRSGAT